MEQILCIAMVGNIRSLILFTLSYPSDGPGAFSFSTHICSAACSFGALIAEKIILTRKEDGLLTPVELTGTETRDLP